MKLLHIQSEMYKHSYFINIIIVMIQNINLKFNEFEFQIEISSDDILFFFNNILLSFVIEHLQLFTIILLMINCCSLFYLN